MRHIGQFNKLLWGVGLGFAAGVVFVAILPWVREPFAPSRPDPLPLTSTERRVEVPAKPELFISENPVSLPKESVASTALSDQVRESLKVIAERNIFSRRRTPASNANGAVLSGTAGGDGATQAEAKQPLPFRLLGTVASDERDSYAVLEVIETKAQDIYRVGQMIGDARLDRIEQNRVVVLRNGNRETLELVLTGQSSAPAPVVAASPPSAPQPGPEDLVRVAMDGARQINTSAASSPASRAAQSLLRRMKLSPSIVDGESVGLRISGLEDSTTAQLIGLKDGDVIQSVNHHPVTNRRKAVQVLSKARRSGSAELSLTRGQQPRSLVLQTSAW